VQAAGHKEIGVFAVTLSLAPSCSTQLKTKGWAGARVGAAHKDEALKSGSPARFPLEARCGRPVCGVAWPGRGRTPCLQTAGPQPGPWPGSQTPGPAL
jgi:hypothetical protein